MKELEHVILSDKWIVVHHLVKFDLKFEEKIIEKDICYFIILHIS